MTQATLLRQEEKNAVSVLKPRLKLLHPVLEFFLVLIVGLLLLEPIMTLAGVCDEQNQDIDVPTGWTLMPNRTFTFRQEGYSRSTINSHGMRDIERSLAKPVNTYRIAVLGCSQTEGNQVPIDQTYCQVLEKELNAGGGPIKYEVLNFAVSAYTIGQQYLRMNNLAMKFKPDLVIFAARPNALLYMGRAGNASFHDSRPLFGLSLDGKLLVDRNYQKLWLNSREGKRMENSRLLRYHSRLWSLLGTSAYELNNFRWRVQGTLIGLSRLLFHRQAWSAHRWKKSEIRANESRALPYLGRVAVTIFQEAQNDCRKAGAKFAVVYLPATKTDRNATEVEVLRAGCERESIPFIDLNPEFDQLEQTSRKPLYIRVHLSKQGHRALATYLHSRLAQSLGIL